MEEITADYEGAFFRAEGGLALAFNGGRQEDSAPNITGEVARLGSDESAWFDKKSGVFNDSTKHTSKGSDKKHYHHINLNFNAKHSSPVYGRRKEVAPTNFSIKIWERIA